MTTYNTVADSEIDPESPVLSSTQVKLRDNLLAIAEGDATAPKIQRPALDSAVVIRDKIQTATVSLAGSIPTGGHVYVTLHPYCFFPMIHARNDLGTGAYMTGHNTDGASADLPRIGFKEDGLGGSAGSYDVDYRYINV